MKAKIAKVQTYDELLGIIRQWKSFDDEYVYDFGDWEEYYIELEEVDMSEVNISYPRVISQNRPRYKYCPSCQKKGRKTIATTTCLWCSNEEQVEVIMCEDCIVPDHEEHYLYEIVY